MDANRIRVTQTIGHAWVWRLTTPDGHVVTESRPFHTREACEADALEQGLPVSGLSIVARNTAAARVANKVKQWQFSMDYSVNLWRWQHFGSEGQPIASSSATFHSRAECVADARAHGYGRKVVRETVVRGPQR